MYCKVHILTGTEHDHEEYPLPLLESVDFEWYPQRQRTAKAEHDHLRLPLDHELYTWANDQQTAKRNH